MDRNLSTFQEGEKGVKISFFTKQGYDIRGIVHVGANDWYEYQFYRKMGIDNLLGFEPLPAAFRRFYENNRNFKDNFYPLYQLALGDKNKTVLLNVANGDGQSSSIYELHPEYKKEFPNIKFVGQIPVEVKTFVTVVKEFGINIKDYNCLVLDVEGYELKVLKGMGHYLKEFEFLNIELSAFPTFINGPEAGEIIKYLKEHGFEQVSQVEPHNDVFFIREDLV